MSDGRALGRRQSHIAVTSYTLNVNEFCGIVDAALQGVCAFEFRQLGGHEPEHRLLRLRQMTKSPARGVSYSRK